VFADVWSKRDFIAAGVVIVAVVLVALGQAFGWRGLSTAGVVVALVGSAVLVAWRVVGGSDRYDRPDGV
jgi:hypothetical protein